MAWDITVEFPLWGEDGEFPQDGFFYESGDQVNEKHLDALWNGAQTLQDETESALEEIDGNRDGVVDEADYANDSDASTYKGNDIDSDGDGVVDEAEFTNSANAVTYKSNDIDSDGDGQIDSADFADEAGNADTVDGEDASAFADTNHGNEEHNENFVSLSSFNVESGIFTPQNTGTTTIDLNGNYDVIFPNTEHSSEGQSGSSNREHGAYTESVDVANNQITIYHKTSGEFDTLDVKWWALGVSG